MAAATILVTTLDSKNIQIDDPPSRPRFPIGRLDGRLKHGSELVVPIGSHSLARPSGACTPQCGTDANNEEGAKKLTSANLGQKSAMDSNLALQLR